AAVAGDVDAHHALMQDGRALAHQVINVAIDGALVADDGGRAEDDGIAGLDLYHAMIAVGHAGQRGGWLALAAGADNRELARWNGVDVLRADQHAGGHTNIAKLHRHLRVVDHRAANERDLAAMLL